MAPQERTLVLVKPDGMQRGLAGEILHRFERRGLRIVGVKLVQVSNDLAARHYAEHEGKPFYAGLIAYITSSPVLAIVFEGTGAIALVRKTIGKTDPAEAEPGTIRGDLGIEKGRNLVHASDGAESAEREIGLWFAANELIGWPRDVDRWIIE